VLIQTTSRVTGISEETVIDLMVSGLEIKPVQARDLGIIDHIVEQCIPCFQ
jgi:hypothetical protein